ncbi:hypothetical protein ACFLU6_16330, partial [Acidobacteriota bacterium]
ESMNKELEKLKSDAESRIEEANQSAEASIAERERIREEFKGQGKQLALLKKTGAEAFKLATGSLKQRASVQGKLMQADALFDTLNSDKRRLEEELAFAKDDNRLSEQQFKALTGEIERLKQEIQNLTDQRDRLADDAASRSVELNNLKEEIARKYGRPREPVQIIPGGLSFRLLVMFVLAIGASALCFYVISWLMNR